MAGWRQIARAGLPALLSALALCLPSAAAAAPNATIRTTEYGTPHIVAGDDRGIGYGYGYAVARDNICLLAEAYVTVTGERSLYFGPDADFDFHANGAVHKNLDSDLYYRQVLASGVIARQLGEAPPLGVRPEVRELVGGYVEGYNRYLSDAGGSSGIADPACHGKPWVKPITEQLAYARFMQLASLAGGGLAITGIGEAQPPAPGDLGLPPIATAAELSELGERLALGGLGSNALALGSDATKSGAGMVLGNPHLPWPGDYRLYQAHLTIPGRMDVEGATFIGVPFVVIGHTRTFAWSHTTSSAFRFTPVEVSLVPGAPTTYLVDGQPQQMTSRDVTVPVRNPDGTTGKVTRTLWSTRYGPILTELLGLPIFPWSAKSAYAFEDANAENLRYLNHFYETDRARSVAGLEAILKRNQGIPWANTVAADSTGRTLYADGSVVPNVTDEKAQSCNTALGVAAFQQLRLPVLDGSRSACDWGKDDDAVVPGIFGPSHLPFLERRDYVENSNDSYWLANPAKPLEGFARIIGDERTERSLRTRLALRTVRDRLARGKFTLKGLQELMFADDNGAAFLMKDALVGLCESLATLPSSGGPVDKGDACEVLAAWDGRHTLDSRGSVLFQRWEERALPRPIPGANAVGGGSPNDGTWSDSFDRTQPVDTPHELNVSSPAIQRALGDAVSDLRGAGIALDAAPRNVTFAPHAGAPIALHGGTGADGVFDAIDTDWVPGKGYGRVYHGGTFIMASELRGRCPPTRTVVTYSQSGDSTSPHYSDQTRLFAAGRWVTERFCGADVVDSPELTTSRLGCLVPRDGTGARRIAWLAPGLRARRAVSIAGAPGRRLGRRGRRWCVAGGGGVSIALARQRIALVATTSRAQRVAGVHPCARAPRRGWHGAGHGLLVRRRAHTPALVARVAHGRVRWVGLAKRPTARGLQRFARAAGLSVAR